VYPDLGAILARELGRADSPVPDYVSMYTSTEGAPQGGPAFSAPVTPRCFWIKGWPPEISSGSRQ